MTAHGVYPSIAGNDANGFSTNNLIGGLVNGSTQTPPATPDTTAPYLSSASVATDGKSISLSFSEALDAGVKPAGAQFNVLVNGQLQTISDTDVSINWHTVTRPATNHLRHRCGERGLCRQNTNPE